MKDYEITTKEIDISRLIQRVSRPQAGAIATFFGMVRGVTDGKRTLFLEYEAYEEMARKKMEQIGMQIMKRYPEVRIAMVHRIGRLQVSDMVVAIAVSAPHRQEAFEACRYAIEQIKKTVPVWKKEFREDGSFWVEGVECNDQSIPVCRPGRSGGKESSGNFC
ncbi:MAG: molybdenum cofactor biosynthesis protein MoaE [Thermoactinomyces sp.]